MPLLPAADDLKDILQQKWKCLSQCLDAATRNTICTLTGLVSQPGTPQRAGRRRRHLVFTYGTLKREEPNHYNFLNRENGQARFIGTAYTVQQWPLIVTTKWNLPFLVWAQGHGKIVYGEIYEIDDDMLKFADIFEGHPEVYQRDKIHVILYDDTSSNQRPPPSPNQRPPSLDSANQRPAPQGSPNQRSELPGSANQQSAPPGSANQLSDQSCVGDEPTSVDLNPYTVEHHTGENHIVQNHTVPVQNNRGENHTGENHTGENHTGQKAAWMWTGTESGRVVECYAYFLKHIRPSMFDLPCYESYTRSLAPYDTDENITCVEDILNALDESNL